MAFGHGKNVDVYCNGYDLTTYLSSISTPATAGVAETSTFRATSKTFVAGLKDATLSAEGFFDGSADAVDEVLSAALGVAGSEWCWYPQGDAVGNYGYGLNAIETAHETQSTIDDACKIAVAAQSSVGKERIRSLHALGAESDSDWTGTAVDNGESTSNGGSAYLQVTAATGTVEVKIQHSSDNFVADTEDLVSFTAVTGRTSERVTFTGTVKQYVRGFATLAGGETITFNLAIGRD